MTTHPGQFFFTGTPIVNKLEDLYSLLCFPFVRLKEEAALTLLQTGNFWISRPGQIIHSLDRSLL